MSRSRNGLVLAAILIAAASCGRFQRNTPGSGEAPGPNADSPAIMLSVPDEEQEFFTVPRGTVDDDTAGSSLALRGHSSQRGGTSHRSAALSTGMNSRIDPIELMHVDMDARADDMGAATAEAREPEAPSAQEVAGLADTRYESSLHIEDGMQSAEAVVPARPSDASFAASTGAVTPWLLRSGGLHIHYPIWLIGVLLLLGLVVLFILFARRSTRRGEGAVVEAEQAEDADGHTTSEPSSSSAEGLGERREDDELTTSLLLAPSRDVTVRVPTTWQPSLSPVVQPSWSMAHSRQAEVGEGHPEPKLFLDEDNPDATVRMARTALSTGMSARAADLLIPLLKRTDVSNKTLMAAGGILQDIATRGDEHGECYGLAADAFGRVLELEPQRQALQRRIGQCRLE